MKIALVKLHVSVLLAGFTGLFGKWVLLPEIPLVWWRLFLTVILLFPYYRLTRADKAARPARALLYGIGALQALHWVLFYASIKLSTVSVALVCISLMGFCTAVLSPPIMGGRFSAREFLYSGLTVLGIALIFHFDTRYRVGIAVGVVSTIVATLFVIFNKKYASGSDSTAVFFHEIFGATFLMTLLLPVYFHQTAQPPALPSLHDFLLLLILAGVCTVVLYIFELQALRVVSAFTVNLSLNLEPVYAIILAALFLGEAKDFTISFAAGVGLILLSVALQTIHVLRSRPCTAASDRVE